MNKMDKNNLDDSIDLRTLFRLFLRRKWWFIGTAVIVLAVGMFYVISKPTTYEVRYRFILNDDYVQDDYLQYSDTQDKYIANQSVFIGAGDVPLIIKTEPIVKGLDGIEEIGDYTTYVESSLISIDINKDTSFFSLKVKENDKKLSKNIALGLLESLAQRIKESDIEIFENTLAMIDKDIKTLEDEIAEFEGEIANLDEGVFEQKAEILIYKEKIIDNDYQIKNLNDLYQRFLSEKNNVGNRIEIITKDPSYNIENNRIINSIIVILLSILTGIVVVLAVNYIYKLKRK